MCGAHPLTVVMAAEGRADFMSTSSGGRKIYDDGIYEMLWDCKFCGTQKLLGNSQKFCPNCGSPQDPEWRYFPSDEEKVAAKDHVYEGADKTCPACGSLVAARVEYCPRCGSPQTAAAQVKLVATRERRENESFATEDLDARQVAQFKAATGQTKPQKADGGGPKLWQIGLGVGLVALVGFILFAVFATRSASVYVSDFRWERSVQLQALQAVNDRADCGAVPLGAYNVDRRYEQVGSRQVQTGETCTVRQVDLGNGNFQQQRVCDPVYSSEPVMGYVCYYTMNVWLNSRAVKAEGNKSQAPTWPNPQLSDTGRCAACANSTSLACLRCEREGGREEKYFLVLRGDGENVFECPVPFSQWESTQVETAFTVEVGRVMGGARCNSLQLAQ